MARRLLIVACLLLLSVPAARAEPPADAMEAARSLVTTMKLADQYKALLPAILLSLKPALTQDRPEMERDYDAMMPTMADVFRPYYASMVDGIAAIYATNFTVAELRDIEAFYRQPTGQKMLEKMPVLMQYTRGVWEQLVVSAAGIFAMIAIAWVVRPAFAADLLISMPSGPALGWPEQSITRSAPNKPFRRWVNITPRGQPEVPQVTVTALERCEQPGQAQRHMGALIERQQQQFEMHDAFI